jgi:hypothetical protein
LLGIEFVEFVEFVEFEFVVAEWVLGLFAEFVRVWQEVVAGEALGLQISLPGLGWTLPARELLQGNVGFVEVEVVVIVVAEVAIEVEVEIEIGLEVEIGVEVEIEIEVEIEVGSVFFSTLPF